MCGRFTLTTPGSILVESFGVPELEDLDPRYNIAPTQPVPCLRPASDPSSLELAMLRWGLVPRWADDPSIGNRMINARSETVADKPAFRDAFRSRRCLVIADGFYEWKRLDGRKQPYHVRMADGRPFAFAGLWERWRPRNGSDRTVDADKAGGADGAIESSVVLTAPPNELVADIHDRMPVILPRERYDDWLDPGRGDDGGAALQELLSPYPADEMEAYPVSTFVNAPANDAPQCVEPLYADPQQEQGKRPRTGRLF